jgi:hypothetical protein
MVLNCQVTELAGMPDKWRQIDRVEIDEASKIITFAVERTLGTNDEISFTYGPEAENRRGDAVAFERVDAGLRIVALRLATPTAIWVEPSLVRFVSLNAVGVQYAEFECR